MQNCGAKDFWWTPLVNQSIRGFWEYASTSWTINGQVMPRKAAQSGGNTAIADTGTTLALVDDDTVAAICAHPCSPRSSKLILIRCNRQRYPQLPLRLQQPRLRLSHQHCRSQPPRSRFRCRRQDVLRAQRSSSLRRDRTRLGLRRCPEPW
jgi:hypothetical protein